MAGTTRDHGFGVMRHPSEQLEVLSADQPRLKGRWIVPAVESGWADYALSEWELTAAGLADQHPHDEVTFVLEGELFITVDGVTVAGRPGDTIVVPGGSVGQYWAPVHARMLAMYGPNPRGRKSRLVKYWELGDAPDGEHEEETV